MVSDQDALAHIPVSLQRPVGVGQHQPTHTRCGSRPYRVHDGARTVTLVQVGAADEDEDSAISQAGRASEPRMTGSGRGEEAGQLGDGKLRDRLPEGVGRGPPPRAQDDRIVVGVRAG